MSIAQFLFLWNPSQDQGSSKSLTVFKSINDAVP